MHVYLLLFGIMIIYPIKIWINSIPRENDPWHGLVDEDDINEDYKICLNCGCEILSKHQHYCSRCGYVAGEYTRYIPFVNIPFNYSIYHRLWHRLFEKETSIIEWINSFVFILLTAPLMLVVGFPVKLFLFIKRELFTGHI